jgi:hypothetical protein
MPARTPSGLPRPLRYGCVATLLACALTCAALLALLPHDSPAAFVYPGAVPSRATPAPQLGLYGAFETSDSVDTVARWYAARGLTGAAMTGGARRAAGGARRACASRAWGARSSSGARSTTWRSPTPATP